MDIISFVSEAKEHVVNKLMESSEASKLEKQVFSFTAGSAEVSLITGGAIEKASITHMILDNVTPPEGGDPSDYMVFQMEIFPENPSCPMGHFNTEWSMGADGPYHMNLDIFPAVIIDDDINFIKLEMDKVADKFGVDKGQMRNGLKESYNMGHWDAPLAVNAGCRLLKLTAEKLDLFIDAYYTFFNSYINVFKSRKNTAYNKTLNNLKLKRNGMWLEYLALKDSAIKMAVDIGITPELIIKLGFPPSAMF